jgi:uncharacterized protein DUF547
MKTIRLLFCFTLSLAAAMTASGQKSDWVSSYNALLGKYVTSGGVKYAEWKANAGDVQALQGVVDGIAKEGAPSDRKQQIAFYCNAYNAWILHETLEKYPTKSVKDALFTFFTSKRITVAGQQTSFKALEDNVIRKLGEPRVHFALNCASRSCPPLNRQAFTAANLDGQLESLAKGYINSDRGVRLDAATKTADLSKIFDWYKDDFKGEGGPLAFINKRRPAPLPADTKITYQDYDWGLNEAR